MMGGQSSNKIEGYFVNDHAKPPMPANGRLRSAR